MSDRRAFAEEPDVDEKRPVTLARAIRTSFASYLDDIVLFVAVNLGLVLVAALLVTLTAIAPILLVLAPLLALPTAALMRLAIVAARDGSPGWGMARDELGRLALRKVGLAAIQLLIFVLSLINVSLAPGIGGIPGILSALVAGYALVASSVYATAVWPIVCDPLRAGPLREQLRLGLAVMLLRPVQLAVLTLIAALAGFVCVQLIAPAVFLPSLVMLAIAAYVVDAADRLHPAEG